MSKPAVIEGEIEPKANKVVAKRKIEALPAPAVTDPKLALIERIMRDPTLSIERVNQAFDFFERTEKAEAFKAFNIAMADSKAKFKPIVKKNQVSFGTTSYKHEGLDDIAEIVDPIMAENGLGYRYRGTSNPNEPVSVTCIVFHRSGYAEETTLRAGADTSGGKNAIQAIGSTVTYLQRYTLRLALGLSTTKDDDGRGGEQPSKPVERITEKQRDELSAMLKLTPEPAANTTIILMHFKAEKLEDLTAGQFHMAKAQLQKRFGL